MGRVSVDHLVRAFGLQKYLVSYVIFGVATLYLQGFLAGNFFGEYVASSLFVAVSATLSSVLGIIGDRLVKRLTQSINEYNRAVASGKVKGAVISPSKARKTLKSLALSIVFIVPMLHFFTQTVEVVLMTYIGLDKWVLVSSIAGSSVFFLSVLPTLEKVEIG